MAAVDRTLAHQIAEATACRSGLVPLLSGYLVQGRALELAESADCESLTGLNARVLRLDMFWNSASRYGVFAKRVMISQFCRHTRSENGGSVNDDLSTAPHRQKAERNYLVDLLQW